MSNIHINNVGKAVLCDLAHRLKQMDAGEVDPRWTLPYNLEPHNYPMNWMTQRYYTGSNVVLLDGYGSEFLTMRQIKALQRRKKYQHIRLREGCESCTALFYAAAGSAPVIRRYELYSLDDVEGLELRRHGKIYNHTPTSAQAELEAILHVYFQHAGISVRHIKSAYCRFVPDRRRIDIPCSHYFRSYAEYLSCLAHETVHSTAEAMGRELDFDRDLDEYAVEELTAELGGALLLHIYNIADETTTHNSAAYIHSWLRRFAAPMKMLDTSIDTARAAIKYIAPSQFDMFAQNALNLTFFR